MDAVPLVACRTGAPRPCLLPASAPIGYRRAHHVLTTRARADDPARTRNDQGGPMPIAKAAGAIAAAAILASLAGCSSTKTPTPREPVATVSSKTTNDTIHREEAVSAEATVTAINQKTREVTLRVHDGSETTFHVDESVKNLPQVRKGDLVTATYYRAVAARIRKPGEAKPSVTTGGGLETAAPGEKPGAVHAQ